MSGETENTGERLSFLISKVVEENTEGLEKLAREEVAESRRNESIVHRKVRKWKRELGLRKSGAKKIELG